MSETDGVTFTPGTRFMMNSAATVALGCPTSFGLCQIHNQKHYPTRGQPNNLPEQKLAIEIADIDCIHINNMNILEASKRQIG